MTLRRVMWREDGASAVEFALIAPVLIILVFGIIQFGIVFSQDLAISNAARQGARTGVVAGNTCLDVIDDVIQGAGTVALDTSAISIVMNRSDQGPPVCNSSLSAQPCAGAAPGAHLTVTAQYVGTLNIPLVMSRNVDVDGEGVFRCEYS